MVDRLHDAFAGGKQNSPSRAMPTGEVPDQAACDPEPTYRHDRWMAADGVIETLDHAYPVVVREGPRHARLPGCYREPMRHLWIVALVACGGGASDRPAVELDPLPAPPALTSSAPREQRATVAKDTLKKPDPGRVSQREAERFADLLAGEGTSSSTGDMSRRVRGADLGAQIDAARDSGRTVVIGGGAARGGGDLRVGTGIGPSTLPPPSSGPTGRVSVSSKAGMDEATLTPDIVLAKIQVAYMAGIKRCYLEALKKDATAKGAVKLRFTVNATGRTIDPTVTGVSPELESCMSGQMTSWRFPIPHDKDGEATTATFAIGLAVDPA
jgi:hypothetical protein